MLLEVVYETTNPDSPDCDCGCRLFWLERLSDLPVAIAWLASTYQLCLESELSHHAHHHTHNAHHALSVGDRFYIMDRGSIVASGPIKELGEELVKKHLTV